MVYLKVTQILINYDGKYHKQENNNISRTKFGVTRISQVIQNVDMIYLSVINVSWDLSQP